MKEGKLAGVPFIDEASVHYECKTVHRNDLSNANLDESLVREFYPKGDFHRVYFGEILGVYRH